MTETIRMVSVKDLPLLWHKIEPMVQQSLVHGNNEFTTHDLLMLCLHASAQCWVLEDSENKILGTAITRYIQYTEFKELCIVTCTAKGFLVKHGEEVLKQFEDFARESGCTTVSIVGRKGWNRFLPEEYTSPYVTYVRRL